MTNYTGYTGFARQCEVCGFISANEDNRYHFEDKGFMKEILIRNDEIVA